MGNLGEVLFKCVHIFEVVLWCILAVSVIVVPVECDSAVKHFFSLLLLLFNTVDFDIPRQNNTRKNDKRVNEILISTV